MPDTDDERLSESSPWTHPLCELCWRVYAAGLKRDWQQVARIGKDVRVVEICCGCGLVTGEGIYVRAAPGAMEFCGNHSSVEERQRREDG